MYIILINILNRLLYVVRILYVEKCSIGLCCNRIRMIMKIYLNLLFPLNFYSWLLFLGFLFFIYLDYYNMGIQLILAK